MNDSGEFSEADFDACFKEFDKDGSGTIEKDEMAVFIKKVAGLWAQPKIAAMVYRRRSLNARPKWGDRKPDSWLTLTKNDEIIPFNSLLYFYFSYIFLFNYLHLTLLRNQVMLNIKKKFVSNL